MKYLVAFCCLSLIVVLFSSCKTKQYALEENPEPKITFGSGGGFTGMYTHYILFKNGQLYRQKGSEESFTAMNNADKNDTNQAFRNYKVLNLDKEEINAPGNMNYYIEYKDKDGTHRLTWGGSDKQASTELKLYYQLLIKLAKTSIENSKS